MNRKNVHTYFALRFKSSAAFGLCRGCFFYSVGRETGCLRIGENKSVFVILKINLFLYYANIMFYI